MSFYLLLAALFWLLAWVAYAQPQRQKICDRLALILFVAVAGLRFETGYDWLAYSHYFEAVKDPAICYRGPAMEPLFWLLTRAVTLVGSVQLLFFIIAALSAAALWWFCKHCRGSFALTAAIFFGWAYLPLEMGALRQSLAMSLILVAFVLIDRRRQIAGGITGIAALGFQSSSLIYLPLLVRAPWRRLLRYAAPLCVLCILYVLLLPSLATVLLPLLAKADLGFLSAKLATYHLLGARTVTPAMLGLLALNSAFLIYARRLVKDDADAWLLAPLMLEILFEGLMGDYPIFWMRVLPLAVVAQTVFIGRTLDRQSPRAQRLLLLAVMVLSLAALGYFFRNPETTRPFVPYQSVLAKPVPAMPSDSCTRSLQFYKYVGRDLTKAQRCAMAASGRACHAVGFGTAPGEKTTATCYRTLLDQEKGCPR